MKRLKVGKIAVLCGMLLLVSFQEARSADYSLTVGNEIYKTNNNSHSPCDPVTFEFWATDGSGSRNSGSLYGSVTSLTIKNAKGCSSMSLYAKCHYYRTSYTNYGRMSQVGQSMWVDEEKTQSLACGCHKAVVGLQVNNLGNGVASQALSITCQ